jgi:hypothetical protein
MSGGYSDIKKINKSDKIIQALEIKGIYEKNNYFIIPVNMGEFKLYTVKYCNDSVSPLFDNLQEAISVFLKLTSN